MIDDFLEHEISVGSFPGAVYAVGTSGGIENENALGHAVAVPLRIPATLETLYDCASLTKPLVTATLILMAVTEGRIALDDAWHGFTFRELLTHTSGLRAWMPLYAYGDYLQTILEQGKEHERGTHVVYSDLNFVLLWYAIQAIYGDYAAAARERIFVPLGIEHEAMLHPPASLKPRIAATEWGQRFERKQANRFDIAPDRQGLIWGETHDGNSFYAGGTAGNAGLFATARAVFRLAQSWTRAELLPYSIVKEATRNHTPGMEEDRGLGWKLQDGRYGHTGFTGTCLWIGESKIYVLLANRVHPCAAPIAMQRIRSEFMHLA